MRAGGKLGNASGTVKVFGEGGGEGWKQIQRRLKRKGEAGVAIRTFNWAAFSRSYSFCRGERSFRVISSKESFDSRTS